MAKEPSPELSCEEIFALLSEYVDGDLTPELIKCIGKHISACAPCVQFVESLRRSVALCGDFAPSCRPAALPEEVVSKLRLAYQEALASSADQMNQPKAGGTA